MDTYGNRRGERRKIFRIDIMNYKKINNEKNRKK